MLTTCEWSQEGPEVLKAICGCRFDSKLQGILSMLPHARHPAKNQMRSLLSRSSGPGWRDTWQWPQDHANRALSTGPASTPRSQCSTCGSSKVDEVRNEGHLILKNTDGEKMAKMEITTSNNRNISKGKTVFQLFNFIN